MEALFKRKPVDIEINKHCKQRWTSTVTIKVDFLRTGTNELLKLKTIYLSGDYDL